MLSHGVCHEGAYGGAAVKDCHRRFAAGRGVEGEELEEHDGPQVRHEAKMLDAVLVSGGKVAALEHNIRKHTWVAW